MLATAGWDQVIRLWNPITGQPLFTLKGHKAEVTGLAFSWDGKSLASAAWDRTIRFWDPFTGEETGCLTEQGLQPRHPDLEAAYRFYGATWPANRSSQGTYAASVCLAGISHTASCRASSVRSVQRISSTSASRGITGSSGRDFAAGCTNDTAHDVSTIGEQTNRNRRRRFAGRGNRGPIARRFQWSSQWFPGCSESEPASARLRRGRCVDYFMGCRLVIPPANT